MKTCCFFTLLLCCSFLSAQEICDNGIDDDGDLDIDLLDSDCICERSPEGITADFEDNSCCPTSLTFGPGTGYFCMNNEWDFASEASPDYYNAACGFLFGGLTAVPLPIPSGNGAIAFATRQDDDYNEGVARCLDCTLLADQDYELSFFVGFNGDVSTSSSSPVEFAIYGKADCGNIPAAGTACLEGLANWVELATFTASGNDGEWVQVNGSFTAPFDIAALAFSKSCAYVAGPNHSPGIATEYHFVDNLTISGLFAGPDCGAPEVTAELEGDCVSGYTLRANASPNDAVDYQWYLDGVAIAGATLNAWSIDPVIVGNYQVLATFADGDCAISEPVVFNFELGFLNVDGLVDDPACFGEATGGIELSIEGSSAPFTIQWNTGSEQSTLEGIGAGTYSATITDDDNCFAVYTTTVVEPDPIFIDLDIEQPAGSGGGSARIFPTGGTPPFQYQWSNGSSGSEEFDLPAGGYSVTITDDNGCTEVVTFNIQEPFVLNVAVAAEACAGDCQGSVLVMASGGLAPYTYLWDIPGTTNIQENLCAGVYSFTVTDASGTTSSNTVAVSPGASFELVVQETNARCTSIATTDLEVSITGGQAPFTFTWSTGVNERGLLNVPPGVYELTVTDAAGCQTEETYTVEAYRPLEVDFTTAATNCDRDEFQLVAAPPYPEDIIYFLNGDQINFGANGTLTGLTAGSYVLSYEDADGCTEDIGEFNLVAGPSYELFVDESTRQVKYSEDLNLEILVNPETQLLLDNQITWSTINPFNCLKVIEGECPEIRLNPTESEVVRLRFRDENGCERQFTIPIRVNIPDYIYVPNVFSPNNDGRNDEFTFFVTDFVRTVKAVQIFDRWGALVYKNKASQAASPQYWDGQFQGQLVASGVYIYTILLELVTGEEVVFSGDVTVIH